ncbi:MAG: hypothetical protein M1839_003541 [Geoglossum umbratile]|nr:MAG: hypothetical protein M1839_003541 [Geoglossum umbratile]
MTPRLAIWLYIYDPDVDTDDCSTPAILDSSQLGSLITTALLARAGLKYTKSEEYRSIFMDSVYEPIGTVRLMCHANRAWRSHPNHLFYVIEDAEWPVIFDPTSPLYQDVFPPPVPMAGVTIVGNSETDEEKRARELEEADTAKRREQIAQEQRAEEERKRLEYMKQGQLPESNLEVQTANNGSGEAAQLARGNSN